MSDRRHSENETSRTFQRWLESGPIDVLAQMGERKDGGNAGRVSSRGESARYEPGSPPAELGG